MLLLMASLASASLLVSRSFINDVIAVGEPLTVRYQIANSDPELLLDVTLYDPTFSRKIFRFVEGKTKVLLTYGNIKPGQTLHVDLDLVPKYEHEVSLQNIQVNYTRLNGTLETTEVNSEGSFNVLSETDYRVRNVWKFYDVALFAVFFILSAVIPLSYSAYLRRARFDRVKRSLKRS